MYQQPHVLIVDDHPINQEIIRAVLMQHGVMVTVAANGMEALDQHARQQFDCIFMDMEMPLMDGTEATRSIRERERFTGKHVRIIALTANRSPEHQAFCLQAGMDGYLSKPVDTEALMLVLNPENSPVLSAVHDDMSDEQQAANIKSRLYTQGAFGVKIAGLFLKDLPQTLAALEEGIQTQNLQQVAKSAHRLSGAAAMVGVESVSTLAANLEADALTGSSVEHLMQRANQLQAMLYPIAAELKTFVDNQD